MKTADLEVGQTYIEPIPSHRGGFRASRTVLRVLRKMTQAERAEMGAPSWDVTKTIEVERVGRVENGCYSPILRGGQSTWVQPAQLSEPFDVEEAEGLTADLLRRRAERREGARAEVERICGAFAHLGLPENFPLPTVADNPYQPERVVETPRLRLDHFSQLADAIETLVEDR